MEVIWGHFGRQVGTKFDFRCVFVEVQILVKKKGLEQSPRAPKSPQEPPRAPAEGGGSLKELLQTRG